LCIRSSIPAFGSPSGLLRCDALSLLKERVRRTDVARIVIIEIFS
jgi:hypothetical protein